MHTHFMIYHLLGQVTILLPQKAQQAPMFFANESLKEHIFYVYSKSYFSWPKSDEDTNDVISKVTSNQKLFVDRSLSIPSTAVKYNADFFVVLQDEKPHDEVDTKTCHQLVLCLILLYIPSQ